MLKFYQNSISAGVSGEIFIDDCDACYINRNDRNKNLLIKRWLRDFVDITGGEVEWTKLFNRCGIALNELVIFSKIIRKDFKGLKTNILNHYATYLSQNLFKSVDDHDDPQLTISPTIHEYIESPLKYNKATSYNDSSFNLFSKDLVYDVIVPFNDVSFALRFASNFKEFIYLCRKVRAGGYTSSFRGTFNDIESNFWVFFNFYSEEFVWRELGVITQSHIESSAKNKSGWNFLGGGRINARSHRLDITKYVTRALVSNRVHALTFDYNMKPSGCDTSNCYQSKISKWENWSILLNGRKIKNILEEVLNSDPSSGNILWEGDLV